MGVKFGLASEPASMNFVRRNIVQNSTDVACAVLRLKYQTINMSESKYLLFNVDHSEWI